MDRNLKIYDYCVMKLDSPLDLTTEWLKAGNLTDSHTPPDKSVNWVYFKLASPGVLEDELHTGYTTTYGDEVCRDVYPNLNEPSNLCTDDSNFDDFCAALPGSGLFYFMEATHFQVGLTSFNEGCQDYTPKPSVYAYLPKMTKWIFASTQEDSRARLLNAQAQREQSKSTKNKS